MCDDTIGQTTIKEIKEKALSSLEALSADDISKLSGTFFDRSARNAIKNNPFLESKVTQTVAYKKAWSDKLLNKRIELCTQLVGQAYKYRRILFYSLITVMFAETVFVFGILWATSMLEPILCMKDSTLQVVVGATILQVSTMVVMIIKSVYPKDLKQLIDIVSEVSKFQLKKPDEMDEKVPRR